MLKQVSHQLGRHRRLALILNRYRLSSRRGLVAWRGRLPHRLGGPWRGEEGGGRQLGAFLEGVLGRRGLLGNVSSGENVRRLLLLLLLLLLLPLLLESCEAHQHGALPLHLRLRLDQLLPQLPHPQLLLLLLLLHQPLQLQPLDGGEGGHLLGRQRGQQLRRGRLPLGLRHTCRGAH